MTPTQKHPIKKWEVSICELENQDQRLYKVTRRLAQLDVAETKVFVSKEKALEQFHKWLR